MAESAEDRVTTLISDVDSPSFLCITGLPPGKSVKSLVSIDDLSDALKVSSHMIHSYFHFDIGLFPISASVDMR